MTEERFSEEDLAPSPEERREGRLMLIERIATTIAVLVTGAWIGGMIALGACAAPFVFQLTPAPFSGTAMGAAFSRFDQLALGASVLVLAAEVTRTAVSGRRGRTIAPRIRRFVAVLMAAGATYTGIVVTPRIVELHRSGEVRGRGPGGEELDRVHRRAEAVGKAEVLLGMVLVALHVFTLPGSRRREEEEEYDAPLPPGPST